jgi:biotin carboxyl carrier protein
MKINALIDQEKHEVEIRRDGRRVFAKIDAREYEVEVSEPEPNVFLIKQQGKIYEVLVSPLSKLGDPINVRSGSSGVEVKLFDPKRLRGAASIDATADGVAEIRSAMPGKVVRIIGEVGREVEKGEGIIVVEAMKMQNELKSPKQGLVKEIRVSEGETVIAGDILAVIE